MNVLATMSARVRPERTVDIGPETSSTPHQIGPARARIFFRAQEVQTFLAVVQKEVYTVPRTVSSLRRLVSGFEDASTFLVARAAHEEFYAELMMPTMIFTFATHHTTKGMAQPEALLHLGIIIHQQRLPFRTHSVVHVRETLQQFGFSRSSVVLARSTPDSTTVLNAYYSDLTSRVTERRR